MYAKYAYMQIHIHGRRTLSTETQPLFIYFQIMVPGTNVCGSGWVLEYQGYLMDNREGMGSSAICVDKNPDPDRSGRGPPMNQAVTLTHAVVSCGPIPCGPHDQERAMPCVVCSH